MLLEIQNKTFSKKFQNPSNWLLKKTQFVYPWQHLMFSLMYVSKILDFKYNMGGIHPTAGIWDHIDMLVFFNFPKWYILFKGTFEDDFSPIIIKINQSVFWWDWLKCHVTFPYYHVHSYSVFLQVNAISQW